MRPDEELLVSGEVPHDEGGDQLLKPAEFPRGQKDPGTLREIEPLFIVDNSVDGRTGLEYLRQWSEIAKAIDVATGYFEIGSLLALDGDWQKFERIRILFGDEMTARTKKELLRAVRERAERKLDKSIDLAKEDDPFLSGADAVRDALVGEPPQLECRVYAKEKFHAKTFITHSKFDALGSQALVGSSNFTEPGLTRNVELNIRLESSSEVAQLQDWFEAHWDEGEGITDELLKVVERHTREFSPFEVYARSLQALVSRHDLTDTAWEETQSKMFPVLDRYQQEGYWALIDIARQHGGALLCDGVGLGKTFVGLMLIERLVLHEKKRVVLFAPKAVKDSVWTPDLKRYLPHIGGVDGSADYSSLSVFSHTDLSRITNNYPERFERIAELADVVIVDEAHHFRNRGVFGDAEDPEKKSRYHRLYDLIGGGEGDAKAVYLLTATPINNSLNDFKHLVELFSRDQDDYFSSTLGVNSVNGHLRTLRKSLEKQIGTESEISENPEESMRVVEESPLFERLVVQRSRKYAKESQKIESKQEATFPHREDPKVAAYSIRKGHGELLDALDDSFQKKSPLFTLAIYYPLAYYTGDDEIDPLKEGRQRQVVGLIRTSFLKRFESSIYAFERSCDRLLRKLLAFVEVHSETESEKVRLDKWKRRHSELLGYVQGREHEYWDDDEPEDEEEDDLIAPEILHGAEKAKLERDEYDVVEIIQETYSDLDQVITLLEKTRAAEKSEDDKLETLTKLLKSDAVDNQKVVVFTEFADTARYVKRHLDSNGIDGVSQIDSGIKVDRAEVIRRFAPYYNESSSSAIADSGKEEIRVLVSTDVLAEGLNLQDATRLVNYDIHWNPVRLMQRIGRVDRRLNPETEKRIVADHPEQKDNRGTVAFWNFLPPAELDSLLGLYNKLHHKILNISGTLGIEDRGFLKPDIEYDPIKELNSSYEGKESGAERLKLEYEKLLVENPALEEALRALPPGIFSGRTSPSGGSGTFFCYELPALDAEAGEFTLDAGITRWYFHNPETGEILEEPAAIVDRIRSTPQDKRACLADRSVLLSAMEEIRKHIRDGYLKRHNAPVGAKEKLVGWMEVNFE